MAIDIYKNIALDKTETDKKPRSVHMSKDTSAKLAETAKNTKFSQNLIILFGCEAAKQYRLQMRKDLFKRKNNLFKQNKNKKDASGQ